MLTPAATFVPAWSGTAHCVARIRPDGSMVSELEVLTQEAAQREAARLNYLQGVARAQGDYMALQRLTRRHEGRRCVRYFPNESAD